MFNSEKNDPKIKPNILERQKSSPSIGSNRSQKIPPLRAQTPPPTFARTPINPRNVLPPRKLTNKSQSSASSSIQRNRLTQKLPKSAPSATNYKIIKKETPNKADILDLTYNAYLQTCLMVAHGNNIRLQNEQKILKELENLHIKLITMDEKINSLSMDLEKIHFCRCMKEIISKKIERYQSFLDSTDEAELDKQIKVLEDDLHVIRINSFKLPETDKDTQAVLSCLKNIADELKAISEVKKKIQPLSQLHTSLLETKENIQKEQQLKNECEEKLQLAESLVYRELYLKSAILQDQLE